MRSRYLSVELPVQWKHPGHVLPIFLVMTLRTTLRYSHGGECYASTLLSSRSRCWLQTTISIGHRSRIPNAEQSKSDSLVLALLYQQCLGCLVAGLLLRLLLRFHISLTRIGPEFVSRLVWPFCLVPEVLLSVSQLRSLLFDNHRQSLACLLTNARKAPSCMILCKQCTQMLCPTPQT